MSPIQKAALILSIIVLVSTAWANDYSKKGSQPSWEQHMAQKRQKATDEMNRRIQEIENQFSQKGETTPQMQKIKEDQIAYERKKNADLMTFLDKLENTPESERTNAWQTFNMQQKADYEAFQARQKSYWEQKTGSDMKKTK